LLCFNCNQPGHFAAQCTALSVAAAAKVAFIAAHSVPRALSRRPIVYHNVNGIEGLSILIEGWSLKFDYDVWKSVPAAREAGRPSLRHNVGGHIYDTENLQGRDKDLAKRTPSLSRSFQLGANVLRALAVHNGAEATLREPYSYDYPREFHQILNVARDEGLFERHDVIPNICMAQTYEFGIGFGTPLCVRPPTSIRRRALRFRHRLRRR
jgi:hypothetical protein